MTAPPAQDHFALVGTDGALLWATVDEHNRDRIRVRLSTAGGVTLTREQVAHLSDGIADLWRAS